MCKTVRSKPAEGDLDLNDLFGLSIMHLNIHGVPSKISELNQLLNVNLDIKPDVVLLCETFLSCENFDRYKLEGSRHFCNVRKKFKKRGVSIFIRESLH